MIRGQLLTQWPMGYSARVGAELLGNPAAAPIAAPLAAGADQVETFPSTESEATAHYQN